MHGDGEYTYKSGAVYRGQFAKGKIHGKGTVRYPDGAYYVGGWMNNKKHGEGRLVRPSGKTEAGFWVDGRMQQKPASNSSSTAVASTSGFSSAELKFRQNQSSATTTSYPEVTASSPASPLRNCNTVFCEDGVGRYTYRDGTVYEGDFEEGQPYGDGIIRYANGDVYTGGWEESAPDGDGIYVFASGQQVGGYWDNGKLIRRSFEPANKPASSSPPQKARSKAADGISTMYAVVVGIGTYDAMQTLRYTDDDAYQMYAFLKSPEGGALADNQVEILVDEQATRLNIENALAEKLGRADADDIVIFYFSGHGVDGYFVPVDFDGVNNLLSHARVTQLLENSSAKHKLVLADACHSGGLLAAKSATASPTRLYDAFAKTSGGTALLLSSRSSEVSLEANNLRSGVFSHFVMRGMKGEADSDRNRIVTVEELHAYVYRNVRDYTVNRQTPVLSGSFDKAMPVASLR